MGGGGGDRGWSRTRCATASMNPRPHSPDSTPAEQVESTAERHSAFGHTTAHTGVQERTGSPDKHCCRPIKQRAPMHPRPSPGCTRRHLVAPAPQHTGASPDSSGAEQQLLQKTLALQSTSTSSVITRRHGCRILQSPASPTHPGDPFQVVSLSLVVLSTWSPASPSNRQPLYPTRQPRLFIHE